MLYILKSAKKGHYNSYIEFLDRILFEKSYKALEKLDLIKERPRGQKILLLDFSMNDLLLIILWGMRNEVFLISVSIEELYFKKERFLLNRKNLLHVLSKLNIIEIISTHRGAPYQQNLKCVNTFIYDIQYYDLLPVDTLPFEEPRELINFKGTQTIVAIINTSTDKYNVLELETAIRHNPTINFIIVSRKINVPKRDNVIHIDRFISDPELYYLYRHFNHFLATTKTNRPSGIFGRTMQFNKFAIILENSYNETLNYPNSLVIRRLSEINKIDFRKTPEKFDSSIFNDSSLLVDKF